MDHRLSRSALTTPATTTESTEESTEETTIHRRDPYGHNGHDDIVFDLETDTGSAGVLVAVVEEEGVLKVFDYAGN